VDIERSGLSKIAQITPLKRTQELVKFDDGREAVRCYSPANPHYFMDIQGILNPIQIGRLTPSVSTIGDIYLRDKNVVSVGFRQDNNPEKYLGLRPDFNQASGDEQLEFSLETVKIDGKSQACDLSKNQVISPTRVDLGNLVIHSTRQYTRQMVKTSGAVNNFRIEFRIHLKGLKIEHRADLDEYWIFNSKDEFRFRIVKPKIIDTNTFRPLEDGDGDPIQGLVEHSLIDNGDGTYTYIKTPGPDFGKIKLPENFLIDADTVYSTTADGWARERSTGWTATREGAGDSSSFTLSESGFATRAQDRGSDVWEIMRSLFEFDLSALSGTVTAASINITTNSVVGYNDSSVIAQESTATSPFANGDYDSYSALDSGSFGSSGAWAGVDTLNTIEFNTAGKTYVENGLGETIVIMCREETKDYDNVAPTGLNVKNGCYYSDQEGTDKDPYLEITFEEGVSIPVFVHHYQQMMRG